MTARVVDELGRALPDRRGPAPLVERGPRAALWRAAADGGPAAGTAALLALGVLARLRRWAGGSR